jgi:hypothetical protein
MGSFPMTRIEHLEISRMIIGTNWFRGFSHYSAAKSRWIREYMDLDRIVDIMNVFARNGCNAVLSGPEPLMQEAIRRVKEETGVTVHWLCTPSGEDVDELMPGIELSAEVGAAVCMPHQHWTDGNMLVNQKRIIGLERVTERIRELGMIPGLSTHRPETVVVCDTAGYDVATYIQIYNPVGFLCQVETDWICRIINETPKPVIVIKPLAAGRCLPPTGLTFVYGSIKPTDTVCIGTMTPYEAEEDIALARNILAGRGPTGTELQFTRSKSALLREKIDPLATSAPSHSEEEAS